MAVRNSLLTNGHGGTVVYMIYFRLHTMYWSLFSDEDEINTEELLQQLQNSSEATCGPANTQLAQSEEGGYMPVNLAHSAEFV